MHIALSVLAVALTASTHPQKIAVLDVQDVSGDQAAHARLLTQIISGEVARDGTLSVVSSEQIRSMVGFEKQRQLLGCAESSCLAELGGALGVNYLITGQLGKIGSRYRLDLNLIDQRKATAIATRGGFLPAEEDALADATVIMVNDLLLKAGLRDSASAALASHQTVGAPSHTGAYVSFGVAAALLAGAGVMQVVTHNTYQSAVGDYRAGVAENESDAGKKLGWMAPLTDALWVGSAVAAGVGTVLFFTASASGSGGEVSVGGHF